MQITEIRADGSLNVMTINDEPSLTQQQFKDECDINNIMKKYSSTREFQHLTSKVGQYADFTKLTSYQDMLHSVLAAQDAFASLPAEIRKRFRNDPGELLAFIQDDKNYDEALKLGIVESKTPKPNEQTQTQTQTNEPKP